MPHESFVKEAMEWVSPERLADLVERHRAGMTHEDFFNRPEHQPLKDAWQAAVLARGYQELIRKPVQVRLSSHEGFPDFQLKVDGAVFDFESVMVVTRPLGKQYRGDHETGPIMTGEPADLPPFDTGPLERAVAKKVAKKYQGRVHLLVYVNTQGAGADHEVLSQAVSAIVGDAFESVWLMGYGRNAGSTGAPKNFIGCARPSPAMIPCPGWLLVPTLPPSEQ